MTCLFIQSDHPPQFSSILLSDSLIYWAVESRQVTATASKHVSIN